MTTTERHRDWHDEDHAVAETVDPRLFSRLMEFALPFRGALIGAVLLLFVSLGLRLTGPEIIQRTIDGPIAAAAESSGDLAPHLEEVTRYALLFLLVAALSAGAMVAKEWLMNRTGQRIVLSLRTRLFDHVLRLPVSWFDRTPVGWVVTRTTSDVDTLNELFSTGLVSLAYDLVSILAVIGVLIWISPQLALTALLVLPVMVWVSFRFRLRARNAFRATRASLSRLNAFLQERLTGLSVVQLFRREEASSRRFDELNRKYWSDNMLTVRHFALFFPLVDGLSLLILAGTLTHATYLVGEGAVQPGEFIQFWMLLAFVFEPIRELAERYNILQAAMAAAERIFRIFDTAAEDAGRAVVESPPPAPPDAPAIEFTDVSFSYPKGPPVIHDLSFAVGRGERVAIVGHTGAGKTTITALLCRFHETPRGTVRVFGRDVRTMPHDELRTRIAVVQQDVFLFSESIADNIRMGDPAMSRATIERMARAVGAHDFIARLPDGYDTVLSERGENLSTGQRQLVAFARALAADPEILVLDEATSSVDSESEHLIEQATATLMEGRTSLVIAHRLSTVVGADRILVMHKGELREQGTHKELLAARGLYWRLYKLHLAGAEG